MSCFKLVYFRNRKWTLLPLHSSITSEEQDRVFDKPPLNYRKIILSTNIAESSITVSDISYGIKHYIYLIILVIEV